MTTTGPSTDRRITPLTPAVPSRSALDALDRRTARRTAAFTPLESEHRGAPAAVAGRLAELIEAATAETLALSHGVFALAEEAFQEHGSAALVAEAVRAVGVEATVGVFGLDTAVVARIEGGGRDAGESGAASAEGDARRASVPVIAILAEYDALPGVGHGCGHNIIAASAVGAFVALARLAAERPELVPGTVVLLGTPAEEGNSGKELLAREGAFEGLDAAIMAHPFGYDAVDQPFIGRRILRLRFRGVAAHASATPFMGRNALDAVALAYQAVGFLRQHLPPGDRVHGVILEGGTRPSIVPETALLEFYLRSPEADTLRELSERLADIAHGSALATGTTVELEWDPQPFTLPTRFNGPLSRRWAVRQADRGRTTLSSDVVPSELAASTDFGNVSVRVPGIHPVIQVSPPEIALHTHAFAEYARSEAGDRAAIDAAYGLAATALDFLHDPELRRDVAADFQAAGGVLDVERYFE